MMWGCDAVKAQTLEPEFEGEVVGVFPDGSSKKLEKHNVRMRTGAGVYIAGFAASKSKTKVLVEGGSMDYLRFSAEKYGESSYRLTFDERPAGEYGIIVSNPNNVDEKMVIVSTFAIDGGAAAKE